MEGMKKWFRGALTGAAMFAGEAAHSEAAAATPIEQSSKKEWSYEDRTQELTAWASELSIPGLVVERVPAKHPWETVQVYKDGVAMGMLHAQPGKPYTKESLKQAITEFLKNSPLPSAALESTKHTFGDRKPIADEIAFLDEKRTKEIMTKWGVKFDGYLVTPTQDKISTAPLEGNPNDPNKKVIFSHDGESTIVMTCIEKDGGMSVIRIVEGTVQE